MQREDPLGGPPGPAPLSHKRQCVGGGGVVKAARAVHVTDDPLATRWTVSRR